MLPSRDQWFLFMNVPGTTVTLPQGRLNHDAGHLRNVLKKFFSVDEATVKTAILLGKVCEPESPRYLKAVLDSVTQAQNILSRSPRSNSKPVRFLWDLPLEDKTKINTELQEPKEEAKWIYFAWLSGGKEEAPVELDTSLYLLRAVPKRFARNGGQTSNSQNSLIHCPWYHRKEEELEAIPATWMPITVALTEKWIPHEVRDTDVYFAGYNFFA